MTAEDALTAIRGIWARWATHEIDDRSAWAEVTAVVQQAGRPPAGEPGWSANDDERE